MIASEPTRDFDVDDGSSAVAGSKLRAVAGLNGVGS